MARGKFESFIFAVDGVNVGTITLNKDVMDRFGITGLTTLEAAAATAGTKKIGPYDRKVFASRNNQTTNKTVTVGAFRRANVKRKNRVNTGKKIKVPLDYPVVTAPSGKPGQERMTTINFPLRASNYQVARWINTHFASHKPNYFITPAGARFPVGIPQILEQTTGEGDEEEAVAPS